MPRLNRRWQAADGLVAYVSADANTRTPPTQTGIGRLFVCANKTFQAGVAQPGRAAVSKAACCRFNSCHPCPAPVRRRLLDVENSTVDGIREVWPVRDADGGRPDRLPGRGRRMNPPDLGSGDTAFDSRVPDCRSRRRFDHGLGRRALTPEQRVRVPHRRRGTTRAAVAQW
jgi:hypothetical protein